MVAGDVRMGNFAFGGAGVPAARYRRRLPMRVEGVSKAWRRAAHGIGFVLAVGHVAADPVHAERVALVIGNAEYAEAAARLTNPVRDAVAMAEMLDDLGFAVTLVENADIVGMDRGRECFHRAGAPWRHGGVLLLGTRDRAGPRRTICFRWTFLRRMGRFVRSGGRLPRVKSGIG